MSHSPNPPSTTHTFRPWFLYSWLNSISRLNAYEYLKSLQTLCHTKRRTLFVIPLPACNSPFFILRIFPSSIFDWMRRERGDPAWPVHNEIGAQWHTNTSHLRIVIVRTSVPHLPIYIPFSVINMAILPHSDTHLGCPYFFFRKSSQLYYS